MYHAQHNYNSNNLFNACVFDIVLNYNGLINCLFGDLVKGFLPIYLLNKDAVSAYSYVCYVRC